MCPGQSSLGDVSSVPPALAMDVTPRQQMPNPKADQSRTGHGEGGSSAPLRHHTSPEALIPALSWGPCLRAVLLTPLSPFAATAGLALGQTPRLRAAVQFYKPWDSGGLFRPWQIPGSLGQWDSSPHPQAPFSPRTPGPATATRAPNHCLLPWLTSHWCPATCVPIKGSSWATPVQMWGQIGGALSRSGALRSPPSRAPFIHSFTHSFV